MNAAELISARMEGVGFDRILHAVRGGRRPSTLESDHLEFLESMVIEVKGALVEFEAAVKTDNLDGIKATCESLAEIFQMVSDSCES